MPFHKSCNRCFVRSTLWQLDVVQWNVANLFCFSTASRLSCSYAAAKLGTIVRHTCVYILLHVNEPLQNSRFTGFGLVIMLPRLKSNTNKYGARFAWHRSQTRRVLARRGVQGLFKQLQRLCARIHCVRFALSINRKIL